jgi:hypothetical protein
MCAAQAAPSLEASVIQMSARMELLSRTHRQRARRAQEKIAPTFVTVVTLQQGYILAALMACSEEANVCPVPAQQGLCSNIHRPNALEQLVTIVYTVVTQDMLLALPMCAVLTEASVEASVCLDDAQVES